MKHIRSHNRSPTQTNTLLNELSREIEVTLRQGTHPRTREPQWEGQYELPAGSTQATTKCTNPFAAALQLLATPKPITVKVVVNEKEWSGPLAEGEIWVVRPRNYLPGPKILFADALYRAEHSPTIERSAIWWHPMLLDICERMAWDIRSVGTGGMIYVCRWEWNTAPGDRFNNFQAERFRRTTPADRDGGLKAIRSEGGWLRFTIEFSREQPTDTDAYHREYWREDFNIPLYQCTPGWTFLRDYNSRSHFAPVIYAEDGSAFKLPYLLEAPNRGLAGPFDRTKIGHPKTTEFNTTLHDETIRTLLPGRLLVFYDRDTADQVEASDYSFVGVVSSVNRFGGEWEVCFEQNALWFRKDRQWHKLGQPHLGRHGWVLPASQRAFSGFSAMRFRSLWLPEHPENHGGRFVPHYQLHRDDHGNVVSFEGEMELAATLPANTQLTHGDTTGQDPWRLRTTLYVCDPSDGLHNWRVEQMRLPEEVLRRFL